MFYLFHNKKAGAESGFYFLSFLALIFGRGNMVQITTELSLLYQVIIYKLILFMKTMSF